jgi:hypothetical protein
MINLLPNVDPGVQVLIALGLVLLIMFIIFALA